jgi:SAM-dependent methyltransferase
MSDWQERITRDTAPAIRVEHELRYRLAAPLVCTSEVWADLGCGNGLAAAAAFGTGRPAHSVLVDLHADAVARAAAELEIDDATCLCGDLTDARLLDQVGDALLAREGSKIVTCFEVLEHLQSFLPLLDWASRLACERDVTFFLSVPNDAFSSIQNPHHETMWGPGAFEELQRLLPAQRTLLRQVALAGSAMVSFDGAPEPRRVELDAGGAHAVASHFVAVFGARHAEARGSAIAEQTDMLAARRWERERESNLAVAEETVRAQTETLRSHVTQFDQWRTYIHELERELGRPLSGADGAQR